MSFQDFMEQTQKPVPVPDVFGTIASGLSSAAQGVGAYQANRKQDLVSKADALGRIHAIAKSQGDQASMDQAAQQLAPIVKELYNFDVQRNQLPYPSPINPDRMTANGYVDPSQPAQGAMSAGAIPQNNSGGNVGSDFLMANGGPLGRHLASGTLGPYNDNGNRTTSVDPNPMTPMNYGSSLFTSPQMQGGQMAQGGQGGQGDSRPGGMMSAPSSGPDPMAKYAGVPMVAPTSAYSDRSGDLLGSMGYRPEKPIEIPGVGAMDPLTHQMIYRTPPKVPKPPNPLDDELKRAQIKSLGREKFEPDGSYTLGNQRFDRNNNVIATADPKEADPLATESKLVALIDKRRNDLTKKYTKTVGGMKMGVDQASADRDLAAYEKGLRTKLDPTYDTSDNAVPPDMRGAFNTFKTSLHKNEGGGASMNHDTYNDGKGQTWAFGKSQFNLATNPGAWKPLVDAGVLTRDELVSLRTGADSATVAAIQSKLAKAAPLIESLDNKQAAMLWNNATRWIDRNKYQVSDPSVVAQIADIKNQFGPDYDPRGIARNGVITPDSVRAWRQRVPHAGAMNRFSNIQSAFSAAPKPAASKATSLASSYADKFLGPEVGDD